MGEQDLEEQNKYWIGIWSFSPNESKLHLNNLKCLLLLITTYMVNIMENKLAGTITLHNSKASHGQPSFIFGFFPKIVFNE